MPSLKCFNLITIWNSIVFLIKEKNINVLKDLNNIEKITEVDYDHL